MAAIKSGGADAFLADPPVTLRTLLLYGPDSGLVAERAADFIRRILGENHDSLSVVRLDSDTLASDPPRLADEANAQSLFTGQRVIHVRVAGPRPIINALDPVLAAPPIETRIVIEAGDLKKTAALRQRCESSRSAAAVPCYADDGRGLDRLIDEELKKAGQSIAAEARAVLRQAIAGDRMASRGEVRKLSLYVGDVRSITLDDVKAVISDAADLEIDALLSAIATGDAEATERTYRRLLATGTSAAAIGGAIQRYFQMLQRVHAETSGGTSFDEATLGIFPRIIGRQKAATETALRAWSAAALERALVRIDKAVTTGRENGPIVAPIIGELALALAARSGRAPLRQGT